MKNWEQPALISNILNIVYTLHKRKEGRGYNEVTVLDANKQFFLISGIICVDKEVQTRLIHVGTTTLWSNKFSLAVGKAAIGMRHMSIF